MTTAKYGNHEGKLVHVIEEEEIENGEHTVSLETRSGKVAANLKVGADIISAIKLTQGKNLNCNGMMLSGSGFILNQHEANELNCSILIHPYFNGRDLSQTSRDAFIIDAYGLSEDDLRTSYPKVYQHLLLQVKPKRDQSKRKRTKQIWWVFAEPRKRFREAISNINRYITTIETSKHRFFVYKPSSHIPDHKLVNICLETAEHIAILSSSIHVSWALASGSRLEDRPVYVQSACFETFPFPDLDSRPELRDRLRDLGEKLDAHRKARQAEHPDLTLTGMYNVLEKLRKLEPLNPKEKVIHDQGLVTLLKQIHDDIDVAVVEAYGMSEKLNSGSGIPLADRLARGDEELEQAILQFLVALNHERAAEEAMGKIRYLRPDFQDPEGTQKEIDQDLDLPVEQQAILVTTANKKLTWPKTLPEQVAILQDHIPNIGTNATALSLLFGRTSKKRTEEITQILTTLQALGQI